MNKIICIILIQFYIFCTINIQEALALSPSTNVQKTINQYNDSGRSIPKIETNKINNNSESNESNEKTSVIFEKLSKNINENQNKNIAKSIMILGIVSTIVVLIIPITFILLGPVFGIISMPWWGFLICGVATVVFIIVSIIAGVEYSNEYTKEKAEQERKAQELADKQEQERIVKELAEQQRIEKEKQKKIEEEKERKEKERLEKEKKEKERIAKELADKKAKELKEFHFKYLKDFFEKDKEITIKNCDVTKLKQDFKDYVENYKKTWNIKIYVNILQKTKNVQDLLKAQDDSILKIGTEIFPEMIKQEQNKQKISIKKAYDKFMKEWFYKEWDKVATEAIHDIDLEDYYVNASVLGTLLYRSNKEEFTINASNEIKSFWDEIFGKKPFSLYYKKTLKDVYVKAFPLFKQDDNSYKFWDINIRDYFANWICALLAEDLNKEYYLRKYKKFHHKRIAGIIGENNLSHNMLSFMVCSIKEDEMYKKALFKVIARAKRTGKVYDKNAQIAARNASKALVSAMFIGMEIDLLQEKKEFKFDFLNKKYNVKTFKEFIHKFEARIKEQIRNNKDYELDTVKISEVLNVSKQEVVEAFILLKSA